MNPVRVGYVFEQNWHSVPGGTAVASLEVARRLTQRDGVELLAVAGRHRRPPRPGFEIPGPVHLLPFGRPLLYETWNRFGWPLVESVTGPLDLCHTPIAIPAACDAPSVVTVHDVAFLRTPERFTKRGVRVMKAGLQRCRDVDMVLCPSQSTRDDLLELGFDADRTRIVPWGVDTAVPTADERAQLRERYSLPDRFVLAVGTLEPRKNLPRLAEAVRLLDAELPLVIAGPAGWGDVDVGANTSPSSSTASSRARPDPQLLGYVPHTLVPALYEAATVFAYPSLEEGFGMPILEAMAQGTPVVTSRGGATEETAAGAAVLVDPTDVESIANGIEQADRDRDRLSAAGRRRASEMTWDATVAATLAAYDEVIERARQ